MQISQATELYKLMAKRCEDFGSHNQARVYSEMTDLIASCKTIEESSQKIKNSKYYLAPSEALEKDRAEAHRRAAIENGIPELAQVYEEMAPGYEQKAQNIKNKYLTDMQVFADIYRSYVSHIMTEEETYLREIDASKSKLSAPFSELASKSAFRKLIPVNDAGYKNFINFEGVDYPETDEEIDTNLDKHRVKVIAPNYGDEPMRYKFIDG